MNKNYWLHIVFLLSHHYIVAQDILLDKIIAKIDNHIILKSEVEFGYQHYLNSGNEGDKCMVLEQMVINKILLAKAETDSTLEVDNKIVETELDRRMQYFINQAGGEEKLQKYIGKSSTELKEGLREQIKEQLTLQQTQVSITKEIKITPKEVKNFFQKIPKDSIPLLPAYVEVAQIIIYPKINKDVKMKVKKELLAVKQRILMGEDFGEIAQAISEDLSSRSKGGLLGWFNRGELAPEYEATALKMNLNEISNPVETEFGIHLIQLLDRRGNKFNTRHILLRLRSADMDINATKKTLDSLKVLIHRDSISFEKVAQQYSEDNMTKGNGGFFKDPNTADTWLSKEVLEPDIFFIIDTMKIGSISIPIEFRSKDGRKAVRMLYYKSHKESHIADLQTDFQIIANSALEQKKNTSILEEIKRVSSKLYIYFDKEYTQCEIIKKITSFYLE